MLRGRFLTARAGIVLAVVLLAVPALAASDSPPADSSSSAPTDNSTAGPPINATLPVAGKVSISADHFVVEDESHKATFTGNVVVVQTTVTVHADQVVALYGKAGATSISTFQATGHVTLITKDQTGTGDLAVFDPKSHMLTLTGNVVVTSKAGRVQSSKLVVDLAKKQSVFTSNGGRVTGVFSSDD
jgi:lipopolysaccharide export system protein LptA